MEQVSQSEQAEIVLRIFQKRILQELGWEACISLAASSSKGESA